MSNFCRIENDAVVEVITLPEGVAIGEAFHPALDWRAAPAGCAAGWRVWNGEIVAANDYRILREAAYPDFRLYLDAIAKKASTDPATQAAGDAQLAAYTDACLAVKLTYPKPGV